MSRERRSQLRNHDDIRSWVPPSSTRNFCAHTTMGRHKT